MQTTSSIDILNMLVEAGLERKKAEPLAKEILTRNEAIETLATKNDIRIVSSKMDVLTARLNILIGLNVAVFVAILSMVVDRLL